MKKLSQAILSLLLFWGFFHLQLQGQQEASLQFEFEGNTKSKHYEWKGKDYTYVKGIEGQALSIQADKGFQTLSLDKSVFNRTQDFSIQFWVKTTSKKPMTLISQKEFPQKGISTQKNAGWALFSSGGTFAWTIGSGTRRLTYERDNGDKLPINDGKWHQLSLTYSKDLAEVRVYFDGLNKAIYKVGFDFANEQVLSIGTHPNNFDFEHQILPEIEQGAIALQSLVDEFNDLGLVSLQADEFISLVVDPEKLYKEKFTKQNPDKAGLSDGQLSQVLKKVEQIRDQLSYSPYTVFQNRKLTLLKPIYKIYSLEKGKIRIDKSAAKYFTQQEQLYPADFALDNLKTWDRVLSENEVWKGFTQFHQAKKPGIEKNLSELTVGVWNIWHGGIHFNEAEHGWDSRRRIVEIIKEKKVDVILMQETYSSGDFIAAELGYYFATTTDWDYKMQGSNISVISRYPIQEVDVLQETGFMNVSAKLKLSETQEIYAMSNWYGMRSFPLVDSFHQVRFHQADLVPVLFGGDFNAIPHTDGGKSPASLSLLKQGFTDAYRSLYPDVEKYPAYTHISNERIDQLYYKGKGLTNTSTEVISSWPGGFPSDHFLIVSKFKLGN